MSTLPISLSQPFQIQPAGGETSLYLVRHGRTASNVARRLHGATDIPLDAVGFSQAERVAQRLASDAPFDALFTSPLRRAVATARVLGTKLQLSPAAVSGLEEINFGSLEGHTFDRLVLEHPELARRLDDLSDNEFSWPGGESRLGFHQRVIAAFQIIINEFPRGKVIVVAHLGVFSSLLAQISNQNPNDWSAFPMANCALSHVVIGSEGHTLRCVNDAGHLVDLSVNVFADDPK
ncbi:MAG: histidine phosphatase family protein [Chloroflexia bacterium]|nr:histidine phosphatase family protein [Chloroflexia bacterium]